MSFIIVFIMKFLDCSLGTLKTVFLVKDKFFLSSVFNSLSAIMFIFVADIMANAPHEDKFIIALIIFAANMIGGYLPPKMIMRLEEDKLFIYVITSNSFESGTELADKLRELNIAVSTTIVYDSQLNKTITCKAHSISKKESAIIESLLTDDYKWHIIIGAL